MRAIYRAAALGLAALSTLLLTACYAEPVAAGDTTTERTESTMPVPENLAKATVGGGCFWCVEAIFEHVDGVHSVESGYAGGTVDNPTYKQVCTGTTGHAEVVTLHYDPQAVSYDKLLNVFFSTHDPTTLNRQGNDVGTQYRSVIMPHNDEQQQVAEAKIKELNEAGVFDTPIVTTIETVETIYPAEDYHQDYFRLNSQAPYCRLVIQPKLKKFLKQQEEAAKQ